ncbi:MAG: ATP-binding protein [Methanolinea sp.]|nr:ATP-binding protein [Methanolinea sp.]
MVFSFNPLVAAGLAVTAVSFLASVLTWKFRPAMIGRVALLILACASLYSLLFSVSLGITDPSAGLLLIMLELPLRLALPVLSFLFILLYIGEIESITPRIVIFSFLIPMSVLVAALTSPLHPLFVSDLAPVVSEGSVFITMTPGPFFWLSFLYSFVLLIAGLTLALSRFRHSPPIYRIQIMAIVAAFVVPFFLHLGLVFMPGAWTGKVLSLLGFVVTAIAVYLATSRYQFLTLTPVAFPVLLDRMTDGVIIVNVQDLVVGVNPAAARILGKGGTELIGKPAGTLLAGTVPEATVTPPPPDGSRTITLPLDGAMHYYDLHTIPLSGYDRIPGGKILLLHDSHTRYLTEMGLRRSNEKLQLLTTMTRHDILNSLTALVGSLELARAGDLPEDTNHLLAEADRYAAQLQRQVEFTRDYQTLGLQSAQWKNVREALDPYLPLRESLRVLVDPVLGGIAVFADPMFGRVFYNLIENSLRHGGHTSEIRIGGQPYGEEFVITYEDNGIGIPLYEKERIFEKGYGKNTGLGLFLTREILSLTGIRILESGTPGQGVRFEIRVPSNGYRLVTKERSEGR